MHDAASLVENNPLPRTIRDYLREKRGLSDDVIDRFSLSWNGTRITIPIFDRAGQFAFCKYAKDPDDESDSPKMLLPPGARAELYGWEHLRDGAKEIVICEGEFDRLVLEEQGIAAVTSTAGAGTFREEWADALSTVPNLYVCFDNDDAGRTGVKNVVRLLPETRVIKLPEEVGVNGDITDYFVRLKRSADEFKQLMADARPQQISTLALSAKRIPDRNVKTEIALLKARISIADLISGYVRLSLCGHNLRARCPFHNDKTPSFFVFPETQTFHCFGCIAHGDAIEFLMQIEKLTFREAVAVLRELAYGTETEQRERAV